METFYNKVPLVAHADLMQEIVGGFTFMVIMAEPGDNNLKALNDLDLNELKNKADHFFCSHSDGLGFIETHSEQLIILLEKFLQEYSLITDVFAIKKNICWRLIALEQYK